MPINSLEYVALTKDITGTPVTSNVGEGTMSIDQTAPSGDAVWLCIKTGSPDTWVNLLSPDTTVGDFHVGGIVYEGVGSNTQAAAVATTPTIVSGVAYAPNSDVDLMLYVQLAATAADSVTVTFGPTTGAENAVCTALALAIATGTVVTVRLPATGKLVVTAPNSTITTLAVPC
jgi:hypothetical protein